MDDGSLHAVESCRLLCVEAISVKRFGRERRNHVFPDVALLWDIAVAARSVILTGFRASLISVDRTVSCWLPA
jgi:hypothetical protein